MVPGVGRSRQLERADRLAVQQDLALGALIGVTHAERKQDYEMFATRTIDLIQKRVSEHFNLREADLKVRTTAVGAACESPPRSRDAGVG